MNQIEDKSIRPSRQMLGFSMIEIVIVIGIIGVLVAAGTVGYVQQLNRSRVDSAVSVLNANLQQARQMAIAVRQVRRVAIDAGSFDEEASRTRIRRAQIWIEGKRCQEFLFRDPAACQNPSGIGGAQTGPNAWQVAEPDFLPDYVTIADVDGRIPGAGNNPEIFYIEFNPRGSIGKVYFDGEESSTTYNAIAPVIHLTRDNEVFTFGDNTGDYEFALQNGSDTTWDEPDAKERYKIQTVEVVRLTGKTRFYDYAILNPWPLDEPEVEE